jgi:DNA-binding NarL/FixJ family response regulator
VQLAACGARRVREECVRELRRIGLRVAHAGRRGDGAAQGAKVLSGRELQIAELVCARHTNREIAEQLFLSQKTVESHLRSVFVKLGVTSRAQVARALDSRP